MPIATCPSNAQAHPGQIVIEGQRVRRSKKQIEADEAWKKAASIEDSHRAEEEHQRVVQQLKESEDAIEREEEMVCKHTARPDLWYEFLQLASDVFTHS
jgi:SpoVK/Ycf46/Vps4 family AAA+-type ATPase